MWFDTERLPTVRRTVEGDYDAVVSGLCNALGTVWNNWQTDWVGEPVVEVQVERSGSPGRGGRRRGAGRRPTTTQRTPRRQERGNSANRQGNQGGVSNQAGGGRNMSGRGLEQMR